MEHRLEGIDVRKGAGETPRHDHGIRARAECRIREVRDTLALPCRLDPDRDAHRLPHGRYDYFNPVRVELGRHGILLRLARIRGADIELEDTNTGLLDLSRHVDRMIH